MKIKLKSNTLIIISFSFCVFYTMARAWFAKYTGSLGFYAFILFITFFIAMYFINYKFLIKIKKNNFWYYYSMYLIYILLLIIINPNSEKYGFFEYIFYLLMLFAMMYIICHIKMNTILVIYEILGIVIAGEAIWEFITGIIPFRTSYEGVQIIKRAFGLIGSPITLGLMLACISLISVYFGMTHNRNHYLCTILTLVGLLCTQSRGPLVGFIVGYFFLFILLDLNAARFRINKLIKTFFKLVFLVVLIWGVLILLKNRVPFLQTIYLRILTIFNWGRDNATNYERMHRWKITINLFKSNTFFGCGVSSTGVHASTGIISESGVLKKLAETGLVGFGIYYLMFLALITRAWKNLKRNNNIMMALAISEIALIFIENIIMQVVESISIYFVLMIFTAYIICSIQENR